MDLSKFKFDDWVQIWEGGWSFLSCSHFGDEYTKEIKFGRRPFVSKAIIFSSNGRSTAWIRQHDRDVLGRYLSAQVKQKPGLEKNISRNLKSQVDIVLPFEKKYVKNEFKQTSILNYIFPSLLISSLVILIRWFVKRMLE